MLSELKGVVRRYPLIAYVVINYAISWTFLYPAYKIILAAKDKFPPLALFGLIGGYGPSLAALLMLTMTKGRQGVKTGLRKFLQWWQPVGWYLFVLVFPICVEAVAVLLHLRPAVDWKGGLQTVPVAFLIALPFGPLGEELGWRGYFLPELLKRYDPTTATLIVGVVWSAWHVASFVFPGAAIPSFFNVNAWSIFLFFCSLTCEAFVFTYVYLKTKGSLILAILLHMAMNARGNIAEGFFPALQKANSARGGIYITDFLLIAVCMIGCFLFDLVVKERKPVTG
jgi:uncharacterized protein